MIFGLSALAIVVVAVVAVRVFRRPPAAPSGVRRWDEGTPLPDAARLFMDIQIGYEHDIVDGVLRYKFDVDGNRIHKLWRLPVAANVADEMRAIQRISETLAGHGLSLESPPTADTEVQEDLWLALVDAMLGEPTWTAIACDPTVTRESFDSLMSDLVSEWGFDQLWTDLTGVPVPDPSNPA